MTQTALAPTSRSIISSEPGTALCPLMSLHVLLGQRPVRVAYIASQFPAPSETFVYREVRELRRRGWMVTAVSLREPTTRPIELEDLRVERMLVYGQAMKTTLRCFMSELGNRCVPTLCTLWTALCDAISPGEKLPFRERLRLLPQAVAGIGLAKELNDVGVAHIHCHFAHAPTTVGMYAAMQLQVPFSFTGHANDLFQRRSLLKKKLERSAFVSCISRWHREFYRAVCPGNNAIYPVIRCGVDSKSWTESAGEAADDQFHILTVCRLVEKKGVDLLLRGLATWQTSIPWKLTVAGDGPEKIMLESLAKELGLRAKVEFLGAVDNTQVRNLLQSCNVFALACRTDSSGDKDGIPVALMEAMACGVPVISGDLPAIRELITPDVSGLLVDASKPTDWSDAFNKLAGDADVRRLLIRGGRAMVQDEFDLETNVTRLQGMLEKTVRRNRGSLGNRKLPSSTSGMKELPSNTAAPNRKYALITPCRDEARYARRTLDSVVTQTVRPTVWVIVDDGSTDETPKILAEYAAKYPFIKVISRADRGDRKLGGGVIDAFYSGYETINPEDFEYVCKLDLDLDLPQKYFQLLMEKMEQDPRLGTSSGKPYFLHDGKPIMEVCGDENSVGMVKFYRTECFTQIGGFVRELMWDGIDCHRCRQMGWIATSYHDSALQFEHLRPMGTSHKSWWTGRVRHGVGQYFMGTGPSYMLASAVFRFFKPPIVVGSMAMLWGYLRSAIQRKPRYGDAKFRRFLRSYQWACLIRGKRAATELLNQKQAKVWMSEKSAEAV